MQFGGPRLAVDYGTACTRAVIAGSGRSWQGLTIDGSPEPPNVAHVDVNGQITVGSAAWRQGFTDPDGFVGAPLSEGTGTITRHGREIEVSDLIAAMLSLVAAEATAVLGEVPTDVRLTVPAGWGPRRRLWMRKAASRAGLGMPTLVEAPVAAANHQVLSGVQLPVGAFVLVCDLGATVEASVVRRGPGGFELLSTLFDADAGGQAIDGLLAGMLGVAPSWPVLANVRTGKEAVSFEAAVRVSMPPPEPAVVINAEQVEATALPVLKRAADLAAAAVQAGELTTADLAAVYVVGAGANMPAVPGVLQERLAVPVQVVPMPGAAAVLGAADASGTPAAEVVSPQMPAPSVRAMVGLLVPGLLSLVLFAHFVFSAEFSGSRLLHERPWWVWANYGELAIACVLALSVCLTFGPWAGAVLARDQRLRGRWDGAGQLSAGMFTAVAVAGTVCALYAVIASLYFLVPYGKQLRWALLPILPSVLIAIAVTVLLRRRPAVLTEGLPLAAVLMIGGGDLVFGYTITSRHVPELHVLYLIAERAGFALVGVGIALILFRIALLRWVAAVALGGLGFFIADWRTANLAGVAVALAVTGWWAQRLWAQLR